MLASRCRCSFDVPSVPPTLCWFSYSHAYLPGRCFSACENTVTSHASPFSRLRKHLLTFALSVSWNPMSEHPAASTSTKVTRQLSCTLLLPPLSLLSLSSVLPEGRVPLHQGPVRADLFGHWGHVVCLPGETQLVSFSPQLSPTLRRLRMSPR